MYPPQPMQMRPQRQFGVRDFITAIIYVIVGVVILIGFFALPLLNTETLSRSIDVSEISNLSASKIASEATSSQTISLLYNTLTDARALARLIPFYALYTYIALAVLFFIGALGSLLKAIFRGGQGVGFFGGAFRILIVPIFYILLPLAVAISFYAFALQVYDLADVVANPRTFRLDTVLDVVEVVPPGMGMILMVGGSIFGAIITILSTLVGMFTRSAPQVIVMQQPAYGMPPQYGQYPPQYGAQPPYGQYPPNQTPPYQQPPIQPPYGQYPPTQTPPYQQPPVQNPYGNQPPQNPYGAPPPQYPPNQPSQNPIDWGKKRDDDDF